MKKIYVILIILLIGFKTGYNETIYKIAPQSESNKIILTIDNISQLVDAGETQVVLIRYPEFVLFEKKIVNCQRIEAGNSSAVEFTFNVLRSAPVNKKDTLEFEITESNGGVWIKQIIIEYLPPGVFKLEQNFPNPFNPITSIRYQLPEAANVKLAIYNMLGQKVATLVNKEQQAGYYDVNFDATDLASGLYVYRLQAGRYHSVKKMMILK